MRLFSSHSVYRTQSPVSFEICTRMSRSRRWRVRTPSEKAARAASSAAKMEQKTDYSAWSQESLIERVTQLEIDLKNKTSLLESSGLQISTPLIEPGKKPRDFDASKYSTRLIALKLAYLGKQYHGFEHHTNPNSTSPISTIESELWKALTKGRLIFPQDMDSLKPGEINWEGTDFSKCGRTDKGVSAFGQVIGIRVRSNRPLAKQNGKNSENKENQKTERGMGDVCDTFPRDGALETVSPPLATSSQVHDKFFKATENLSLDDPEFEETLKFDSIEDEIPYCFVLNRLLPPDIRILAWCPAPPLGFSARFSCRERQYRYFFTQPAFCPVPSNLEDPEKPQSVKMKDGWLDFEAMKEAAKMFEGLHDFRNFCKIDAAKQISNYERRIYHADIEEVDDPTGAIPFLNTSEFLPSRSTGLVEKNPKVYAFTLHGSAFLWHQVRHMVAILFLIGQGLERPSLVSDLLNVHTTPRRPTYELASDVPLVLWDCIFPREDDPERKDALQWHYMGSGTGNGAQKYGKAGLMGDVWSVWRERKIDEVLASTLLDVVAGQGEPARELTKKTGERWQSQRVFDGGDVPRLHGNYVEVLKKPRLASVQVLNDKFAVKKGFKNAEDLKAHGVKRVGRANSAGTPSMEDLASSNL